MHAYIEMLLRDLERVRQAFDRADVMPLGSAALAGATYPLDREAVAAELGFGAISRNSLDAVSDRDFALDALYACSLIALHVSRLSEELILWSSGEFRFIEIADRFSTGSSIMPQKKNADIAELGRGKSGRVFGNLVGLLTTMKGLPLAYNKDSQEDKEGLIDSFDTILAVLDVFPPMVRSITVHGDRTAAAAIEDFTLATDAADLLAKAGVPFREAHEVVGSLVARCIAGGKTFAMLTRRGVGGGPSDLRRATPAPRWRGQCCVARRAGRNRPTARRRGAGGAGAPGCRGGRLDLRDTNITQRPVYTTGVLRRFLTPRRGYPIAIIIHDDHHAAP